MLGVTKRSEEFGDVGLTKRPEPSAGPGNVVLSTAAAGICGTDLHIFRNEYKVTPPVVNAAEQARAVRRLLPSANFGCSW